MPVNSILRRSIEAALEKLTGMARSVDIIQRCSSGSINEVFQIRSGESNWIVKVNNEKAFPSMFRYEAEGLAALKVEDGPGVPAVEGYVTVEDFQFLFLEYLERGIPDINRDALFGEQLAQLHRHTRTVFGWPTDNYIGALPQKNEPTSTAAEFFRDQRLIPQWQRAYAQYSGLLPVKEMDRLLGRLPELLPNEPPSLLHGDLWSGNVLGGPDGRLWLIDPSPAYGSREADLAMMKLFGGFSPAVFESYHASFPLQPAFNQRVDLWNLYPLLVHLNLFGAGYLHEVTSIVARFGN